MHQISPSALPSLSHTGLPDHDSPLYTYLCALARFSAAVWRQAPAIPRPGLTYQLKYTVLQAYCTLRESDCRLRYLQYFPEGYGLFSWMKHNLWACRYSS